MKKIYTKTVFEFNKKTGLYEVNQAESEYHFVDANTMIMQMKGGGTPKPAVTNQGPWGPQQDYLKRGFGEAQKHFLDTPTPEYYPGQTVAGFTPEEEEANRLILDRARAGNPMTKEAEEQVRATIRGDYLSGGKGFDAALEAAKHKIIPGVQSQFAAHGRSGSGLAQQAEASAIGDKFAGLYGDERNRQLAASGMAPGMAEHDYYDMDRIGRVGQSKREMDQRRIDADKERFEYNRDIRRKLIEEYMKTVGGNYGSQTTTTPEQEKKMNDLLRIYLASTGGAAAGFATGGPYGAIAGGAAGAIGAYQ